MWADVDTKQDFLNYSEVAELVAEVVLDPVMRPVSVGVFGTWGTGKSTILNLVEAKLVAPEKNHNFIVVRFDAWLYQGFDDARAALMEVIASTLIEAAETNPGILEKAKKLLGRVNKMRALGLLVEGGALAAGIPTFGWLTKGIEAVGDFISGNADEADVEAVKKAGIVAKKHAAGLLEAESQRTPPKEISAFRSEFEDVLTGLNKTLVVFVDNLDRCLPKQTIHTLEALRLFLFMGHTAFVVAADEEMVRHSVSEFFKDPGDRHVTDYLDKLIQVPVRVPRLGIQEVRAYLCLLFASAGGAVEAEKIEALRAALEGNLRRSWKDEPISTEQALAHLGDHPPAEIVMGFSIADRMAPMLATSSLVQGNPRIVKRMLNVVRMRAKVARLRDMPVDEALIAKLALFERCTDSTAIAHLYNEINAAAAGKPQILAALEKLRDDPEKFKENCPEQWGTKSEFIREWLSLEPPLAETDLRPLVYLSRETTPLRALKGGLSAAAAEALKILLRVTNTASPSGRNAVASIPHGEEEDVMSNLIESLRASRDWSSKPPGFDGAFLLAEYSSAAGSMLSTFVHTMMPDKLYPWLKFMVKNKSWFRNKEAS